MDRFGYLVGLGDDALVAAQRLAEWTANAPELEEDVALANIALDQLGQARLLLSYAAEVEGAGRDEDSLAYQRGEREFRNCQLVELPNGDFAVTIAKLLFLATYQHGLYAALRSSTDRRLAAIAAKATKETAYHVEHAALWTRRLGDGTAVGHERMTAAVEQVWPYTHELFSDWVPHGLVAAGVAVAPGTLRADWLSTVESALAEATVPRPDDGWRPGGGRDGVHTEAMGYLLAELQYLHRIFPGAAW
ncbi:phenylacetate-CoA oxygenase subunit PaaC [Actinocatenispora rupis]|uniref:Phenylacetic acid degradation protein n=1 Tax=Actinocatenispora rupis TaxID=519421 RepID=A0A8J3JBZ0_9ACTN|nr:1,2-phenylacetyl-CoA epoxidase subunit PaaC [Actinocatenispora rupis]GID15632.1 phenylacetic acid degradation protein [Actinocatenispora rupis]